MDILLVTGYFILICKYYSFILKREMCVVTCDRNVCSDLLFVFTCLWYPIFYTHTHTQVIKYNLRLPEVDL